MGCHSMQAAGRRVAYHTFSHVLDLDVGFHLERRTGALSRVLERGQLLHRQHVMSASCNTITSVNTNEGPASHKHCTPYTVAWQMTVA